jgi:hypothetical protein
MMKKATTTKKSTHNFQFRDPTIKSPSKIELCLGLLLTRHTTNTFDALGFYGETCLHKKIYVVQKCHRIMVDRVKKAVPNQQKKHLYAHYSITADNRIKALMLMDKLWQQRNAKLLSWSGKSSCSMLTEIDARIAAGKASDLGENSNPYISQSAAWRFYEDEYHTSTSSKLREANK